MRACSALRSPLSPSALLLSALILVGASAGCSGSTAETRRPSTVQEYDALASSAEQAAAQAQRPPEAEAYRREASAHRAAAQALRDAEVSACLGIIEDDHGPLHARELIVRVEPIVESAHSAKATFQRTVGATILFRAAPGMTPEWLQRLSNCHAVRGQVHGSCPSGSRMCPLILHGVSTSVVSTGDGFLVSLRSDDAQTAQEIVVHAQALLGK